MAAYLSSSMKMKRKDLDEVNEDFSDFSLSSPARKIRRLDAELPPIMEEEEADVEMHQQLVPETQVPGVVNEEMAIVLFKPVTSPILHSPSCFSVNLNSDIMSGFKKQFLRSEDSQVERDEDCNGASDECRAVVPWVPSHTLPYRMEAEETAMDIEDDSDCVEQGGSVDLGVESESESIQQWQQQHCMTPQLPQNSFTPIVWYR